MSANDELASADTSTGRVSRRRHKVRIRLWMFEMMSLSGAAATNVGAYIFLYCYDGKISPNWPTFITINTILAIFTTIFKLMALVVNLECLSELKWAWFSEESQPVSHLNTFDQASRGGIWGSWRLLRQLRGRHWAVLGASINILALAADPFTQQSIRYYPCTRPAGNMTASLPITRVYNQSLHTDTTLKHDEQFAHAILDAFLAPEGTSNQLIPTCQTGECGFPARYQTLAMCSRCANLKSFVTVDFNTVTFNFSRYSNVYNETPGAEYFSPERDAMGWTRNQSCVYNLLTARYATPFQHFDPRNTSSRTYPHVSNITFPTLLRNQTIFSIESGLGSDPGPYYQEPWASSPLTNTSALARTLQLPGQPLLWRTIMSSTHAANLTEDAAVNISTVFSSRASEWHDYSVEKPWYIVDGGSAVPCDVGLQTEDLMNGYWDRTINLTEQFDRKTEFTNLTALVPLSSWPNVVSMGCGLSLCARTFTGSVSTGELQENLLEESDLYQFLDTPASDRYPTLIFLPSSCVTANTTYPISEIMDLDAMFSKNSSIDHETPIWWPPNDKVVTFGSLQTLDQLSAKNAIRNRTLFDACQFRVPTSAWRRMQQGSSDLLNTWTDIWNPSNLQGIAAPLVPWQGVTGLGYRHGWEYLGSMFNNGNMTPESLTTVWKALADQLTNHLRMNDRIGSTVTGITYSNETCVRVVYEWLIYSTVLLLFTTAFLIITIWQSRRHFEGERPPWRSSLLPLLGIGVDPRVREHLIRATTPEEMRQRGMEIRLRLDRDERHDWIFRGSTAEEDGESGRSSTSTLTTGAVRVGREQETSTMAVRKCDA